MNNLRVNSKTKINEFKRKHNWLVDSSAIQLNVSDIKNLSDEDIESLKCGDIVNKVDSSGKHAYVVSFKNDTGICLTYVDASCVETQSYDKIEGHWVYNSQDLQQIPLPENSDNGKVLGVNANGKYELKEISGGIKLYKHYFTNSSSITVGGTSFTGVSYYFISTSPDKIVDGTTLNNALSKLVSISNCALYNSSQPWNQPSVCCIKLSYAGGVLSYALALENIGTLSKGDFIDLQLQPLNIASSSVSEL